MTNAGSIAAALYNNWSLTGAGTKTAIAFGTVKDWFDPKYAGKPQISVSDLVEPKGKYFKSAGGTLRVHSYPRYTVNCWVPLKVGVVGTAESQLIEDMRYEVCRIIVAKRSVISDFTPLVPVDMGVPRHEVNGEPRILRYEITLLGAHDKVLG
jgi:hypothetical protein